MNIYFLTFFFFSETGPQVTQVVLKLSLRLRIPDLGFTSLHLPSAGIAGVHPATAFGF